jgi:hypothetical protein
MFAAPLPTGESHETREPFPAMVRHTLAVSDPEFVEELLLSIERLRG